MLVLMIEYDDGAVMGLVLGVQVGVICYEDDNDGAGIKTIAVKNFFYFY